jgi:DNA-binding transcriptional LysR family regulator
MMKFDGLAVFVAVAEAGSITAAARRLGLAKSVVSERLAELERTIDGQLVQRTTRRLSLTEDGQAFLPRARLLLSEADAAVAELSERRGSLVGPLRISAPVSFGALHIGAALYPFLLAHPRIELTLELDDRFVDIAAEGFDAVLRHGPVDDTRLVARRLAASRRALVASPAYLAAHGAPASTDELEGHRAILYANREGDWRFEALGGAIVVRPTVALRVNNGLIMRDAALAGLGITLLPTFMIHRELTSGELQELDVGVQAEGADVYVAYPGERGASAKLAALIEALRRAIGDPPYWDRA